jgi:hypothetical protein
MNPIMPSIIISLYKLQAAGIQHYVSQLIEVNGPHKVMNHLPVGKKCTCFIFWVPVNH